MALDLDCQGVRCWLDEGQIETGDSLIGKIREGIDSVTHVVVVLSPNSIKSQWVRREIEIALSLEIGTQQIKILPVLFKPCKLPEYLSERKCADFTGRLAYEEAFGSLVRSLGVVFNRGALMASRPSSGLGLATNKAASQALPILSVPFHRPFQYIGMSLAAVSAEIGWPSNEIGNVIVETDSCHMLLEAEGNFISSVHVELKPTAPHYQNQEFDSEPVLGAFSINPDELEFVRKQTHCHVYYDHRRKLKISVICWYDGAPLSVGFSAKYYGE